ncbi:microneme protein, putative, partial [Eimeria maxima]
MKVPSALGVLAWATIQASEAVRLDRSFLSLSAEIGISEQQGTTRRSLQDALDDLCRIEAQAACRSGLGHYCNATVYARYDGASNNVNSKEWRCYAEDALDFGVARAGCVDTCGRQKMCPGAYNGVAKTYLSRNSQLKGQVDALKAEYCSAPAPTLQEALDRKCAAFGEEACNQGLWAYCDITLYARHDVGNASQKGREWRCFAQDALDFDMSGDGCVDNCGNLISCRGAVNGTSSKHLSRGNEISSVILGDKEEEEAVEAPDATTPPSMPPSKLQGALDGFCAEEGRRACGQGLNAYCNADMFARFDVGTASQQNKEWRCYVKESLDFGMSGEGCVDDCGNFTSCLGAVNGASTTHLTRDAGLRSALAANKDEFCKTESDAPETSEEEEEAVEAPDATTPPSMPPSKLQGALDGF